MLPWLASNPFYDGVRPLVQYAGEGSGLETWGWGTLALAALAAVVVAVRDATEAVTASALVGAVAVVVGLEAVLQGVRVPWLLPGPGAALTVLAGVATVVLAARIHADPTGNDPDG